MWPHPCGLTPYDHYRPSNTQPTCLPLYLQIMHHQLASTTNNQGLYLNHEGLGKLSQLNPHNPTVDSQFLKPSHQGPGKHSSVNLPNQCYVCSKSFTSSTTLKLHLARHAGQYQYTCKFCNKGFGGSKNLKEHLTLHTGVNYFKCEDCDQDFRHYLKLKVHRRDSHDK